MTGAYRAPRAGDRTDSLACCARCRFDMEAREGIYAETGDGIRPVHAKICQPSLTVREVAGAAGVGPRSKRVTAGDLEVTAGLNRMPRTAAVLAVLGRTDLNRLLPGPRQRRCALVAPALGKALDTGRLDPVAAARIREYTPYQVCRLVARIARESPETTVGGLCDDWICRHRDRL